MSCALRLPGGAAPAGTGLCSTPLGSGCDTLCGRGLVLGFAADFGLCPVSWVGLASIRLSKCCILSLMRFASPKGFAKHFLPSCITLPSGVPSLITLHDSRFRTIFTPSICTPVSSAL